MSSTRESATPAAIDIAPRDSAFRNDAAAKVSGRAQYADDYVFPRMVHAVPVYGDAVRARIRGIEAAEAEAMPGVLRVATAADIPGVLTFGQIDRDMPLLAAGEVRYFGEPLALVVAETREQALAAAGAVTLDLEPLPPLLDSEAALESGAPLIRDGRDDNLVCHHKVRRGDATGALARSEVVLEREFHTHWFEHAYIEPEGAVCFPRQDGVLEIFGSLQHPVSTRRFICAWLDLPYAQVEVFNHPVGGSFGGKDDTASAVAGRAALAATLVKRPVKIIYEREWSIAESYKRPPYRLRYRWGLDESGRLRGAEIDVLADSGPYTSTVPWSTWRSAAQCCGPYRVPEVTADVRAAATNNVFTGAFRGFGSPQVNFTVEQLMDEAAEICGLSPTEIRRRNLLRQGDATVTGQVLDDHVVSLEQVMDAVVAKSGFEEKLSRCSRGEATDGELYGIGLAVSYRGASVGAEAKDFCSCVINGQFDGSILLETGIHENGQGAQSAMMLVLARELGVKLERIRYTEATTSQVPEGGTTVASRGTLMGSGAVVDAARKVKAIVASTLAPRLGGTADEMTFADDRVSGADRSMSWDEAMMAMYDERIYPFAFGSFKAPDVDWDEETGQGSPYFTYVYSAEVAEVIVDAASGKIRVPRVWAAHDVGRAVNPALLRGQIYGGIVMGLGMALTEKLSVSEGRIASLNYNKYKIPTAVDAPEIDITIVENEDPLSPYGCKGIGEPALELIAPAIANALAQATGTRRYTLPLLADGPVGSVAQSGGRIGRSGSGNEEAPGKENV